MDPVTQAFAAINLTLNTAAQLEQLILKLQDRARTLAEAEADRRAASDRLYPKATETDGVAPGE